jgi:hypothetical protein
MPLTSMIDGFNKWRESTSTSPSGKHLGIYRTLTRAYNNYYTSNPQETKQKQRQQESTNYKHTAELALTIQHSLINLAIKHNHTYRRWLTIHNLFIDKLPGQPRLDKLRVIHIYEADWNLLLKYFIAYKVHGEACRAQTVQPEQTGGRPGKCAANTAALTTITSETICLQKLTGATIYNDAKACFDRIIENVSNATLISEGLNPKIAVLHAQTLSTANYIIKTKQGLHDTPNGHMKPEPFLGTGQGAADSMPRWSIQSDLLIRLYNANAISDPIIIPISKAVLMEKIRAFVDDTNSLNLCKSPEELEQLLTNNATIWEALLHLIGGKLELSKCKFTTYKWKADVQGTMKLMTDKTIGKLTIRNSETKQQNHIEEIAANESYKLLGVQMATTQAHLEQDKMVKSKCQNMRKLLQTTNLPPSETWYSYKAIILPTIKYGLVATTIPEPELAINQKHLVHALIPRLGLSRHTPLAVIYASNELGGIGIQDLPTEQGLAHVTFLIGCIRDNKEASRSVFALLESYIVATGLMGSPLIKTGIIPYVESPWMDTTRAFMERNQITIEIPELQVLQPLRQRDQGIMAMAMEYTTKKNRLVAINNCRLFLQINTLAEITTLNGREIWKAAYDGTITQTQNPGLHNITQSTLNWPIQDRPPASAWRIWKKFLCTKLRGNSLALKHKLSEWYQKTDTHRTWTIETSTRKPPKPIKGVHKTKWKKSIEKMIIQADELNLVIYSEQNNDKCTYMWETIIGPQRVAHGRGSAKGHQYQGTDRSELLGVQSALERIETIYQNWTTKPKPNALTIWIKSESIARRLKILWYRITTISTSLEDEAEAQIEISRLLESHPGYRVKLINTNASPIIEDTWKTMETKSGEDVHLDLRPTTKPERVTVKIGESKITANLHNRIRTESTKPQYYKYLQQKYKWKSKILDEINWEPIAQAMAVLTPVLQKTIKEMIHGWLPTNGHPGDNEPTTKICPQCNQENETNLHFLKCPRDRQLWAEKYRTKNTRPVEPPIHQVLVNTITNIMMNNPVALPIEYENIRESQEEIGWNQLLYGRWTKQWTDTYNRETNTTDGTQWASNHIKCIWRHIHQRWRERCDIVL